jgi:hypothetical protein
MMIEVTDYTKKKLLELRNERGILLEGNVLKLMDAGDDEEFQSYIDECVTKDKETRRKRLEINKKIQIQNKELIEGHKENERVNKQLNKALDQAEKSKNDAIKAKEEAEASQIQLAHQKRKAENARKEAEEAKINAENAKAQAENDLELLQKKSQFALIGTIVKASLWVIIGVGIVTTTIYGMAIYNGSTDTAVIGSTWSNIIGILLTNAFSIIGTIMGVKYASENKE